MVSQEIAAHGKKPGLKGGNYSRHCKGLFHLPKDSSLHYSLEVPGYDKHELSRTKRNLTVAPIHEMVDTIVADDPDIRLKLQRLHDTDGLPPNYYTSPIVRNSASLPLPLSLYMDGAPYSLTDSCLGVWIEELVTHRRFCIALVRKRNACHCGCRGWCTYWCLLDWIRYCFQALGEQRWPEARHDGTEWRLPQDQVRSSKAGPLSMAGALIQVRGDWAEFCNLLGYPNHASAMRPCFLVLATEPICMTFLAAAPWGSCGIAMQKAKFRKLPGAANTGCFLTKLLFGKCERACGTISAGQGA